MTENEIAKQIVDVAYKIHTTFGPGLFESVYETVMAYELVNRGLKVVRQQAIPVVWETSTWKRDFAPTSSWRTRSSSRLSQSKI